MAYRSQLTLFECFHSQFSVSHDQHPSSESRDRLDRLRSIRSRSRSTSPQLSCGIKSPSSTSGDLQLLHKSVCDDVALDSPVSISSDSQASEYHEGNSGQCDELLLASSSSTDLCDTAENSVTAVNSRLPSASHGSSVDITTGPSDIAQTPAFPPVRPTNTRFLTTTLPGKARSFNPLWFKSYDWLEYALKMDACFCYPCRMFGAHGSQFGSRPESTFTLTGFRDWKHAT